MKLIILKKFVLVLLLLVVICCFLSFALAPNDWIYDQSVLDTKINQVHYELMLAVHCPVEEMIQYQLGLIKAKLDIISRTYPPVEVYFDTLDKLPRDFKVDLLDSRSPAKVTFYYEKIFDPQSGQMLRIVRDFTANTNFLFTYDSDCFNEDKLRMIDYNGASILESVKSFIFHPYSPEKEGDLSEQKIYFTFIEMSPKVAYSPAELESLRSFWCVMACLQMFIRDFNIVGEAAFPKSREEKRAKADDEFIKEIKSNSLGFIYAYKDYFYAKHKWEVIQWNLRRKSPMLVFGSLAVLVFLYLARKDFEQLLKEELYRQGITLKRSMVFRVILLNWKFVLFPYSAKEMRPEVEKICQQISWRLADEALRNQANDLWNSAKQFGDHGHLLGHYRIASGKAKKSSMECRERELLELAREVQKMRLRQAKVESTTKAIPNVAEPIHRPKREKIQKQDISQQLLEDLLPLLPPPLLESAELCDKLMARLTALKIRKLDKLLFTLMTIRKFGDKVVIALLGRNDLEFLLTDSRFYRAIRADDKQIIFEELDLEEKIVSVAEEIAISDHADLLRDQEVYIFGGYKAEVQKPKLMDAAKELGAKSCQVLSITETSKVKDVIASLSGKDCLVILLATDNKHITKWLLDSKHINYLPVNSLNKKRFQLEIIKGLLQIGNNA